MKNIKQIGAAALVAYGLFPWQTSTALIPSMDGTTVYDTVNNVTWLANFNLRPPTDSASRYALIRAVTSFTHPNL